MDTASKIGVTAAVVAGIIALSVEPGAYTYGNTVFGLTLLLFLRAYVEPFDRDGWETAAYAAAWSLAAMNASGPLLNQLDQPPLQDHNASGQLFLLAWAVIALLIFLWRRWTNFKRDGH